MQTLEKKQFISYWGIGGGSAVVVDESVFNVEQGYTEEDIEDIRSMEVDEVIEFTQMSMLHKVWRVK